MAELKRTNPESVPVEDGKPSVGMLNDILKNTVNTIENSKDKIFEIYEAARREVDNTRAELEIIRQETVATIERVDHLEKSEQLEKQNLVRVSSNFRDYSEEKIKETYEAVKDIQVRLGVAREEERQLRRKRDDCEIRLYHMQKTIIGAEQLAMRISSVLGYLSSQISDVVAQMEKAANNRFLSAVIIKAQEDERYRVSREIHDGPAQDVANLLFQASICERLIPVDPEEARAGIQELRRQLKGCLSDIRQIIFDMRPMSLDDLGLVVAIRQLVSKLDERQTLKADFTVEGTEVPLPSHVNTGIFRIVQEALNNVDRHSGQKVAQIRMLFTAAAVSVLIEDQGAGFDMAVAEEGMKNTNGEGFFGIMGMRERAKIIGAQLNIASTPGRGTRVHLRLPLKMEDKGTSSLAKAREAKADREAAAVNS